MLKTFETWLRARGIHCTNSGADVFIHFDDCASKREQKVVANQAKKLGLFLVICDKGAAFTTKQPQRWPAATLIKK